MLHSLGSAIAGSVTLTPAQTAELLDGKGCVNRHTAARRNGEICGQGVVVPP